MTAYSLGGVVGLLDDPRDPALAVELGHAEVAQVLRVELVGEQDARAPRLGGEALDRRPERPLEDVVGEHHADAVAADEALREPERLRDPAGLLLVGVEELVDPVLVAVAEQAEELARVRAAGDEHQLGRPRRGRAPRSRTRPSAGRRPAAGACS